MREPDFRNRWSVITILIAVLVVVFLIQTVLNVYGRIDVTQQFGLSLDGIKSFKFWQLLTYQFLHASPWPWHLLGNCIGLYFFGTALQQNLGPARLLKIYFAGGFLGGILQVLHGLLPIGHSGGMVGASAGVFALIAAYCAMFPYHEGCFMVYFFPVRLKARTFLIGCFALSGFGVLFPYGQVAHAAHLGGLLCGLAYVRWFHEADEGTSFWRRLIPRRRSGPIVKVRFPKASPARAPRRPNPADKGNTEFIAEEVDPILEKISAHGIHSLTEHERKVLEAARLKIEKK